MYQSAISINQKTWLKSSDFIVIGQSGAWMEFTQPTAATTQN